jgi:probable H4MPT-linked C1 transfer pathway protein
MAVVDFIENPNNGRNLIVKDIETHYLPLWEKLSELPGVLENLLEKHDDKPRVITITTTAELADCFETKKEGVAHLLSVVEELDPSACVFLNDGRIVDLTSGKDETDRVAAANWAASSILIGQLVKEAIFIDAGSTTTDIIPISGGVPVIEDPSDLGRLTNHHLVYTGVLRTNVATIASHVDIGGSRVGTASEYFCTTGDVNLVLGLIKASDYTIPTADGGPVSLSAALRRLARVVCSDTNQLTTTQIEEIARYIHEKQVSRIAHHIEEALKAAGLDSSTTCIIAGIGKSCLAERAATSAGLTSVITLNELLVSILGLDFDLNPKNIDPVAPAISVSLLRALRILGCG